jgi:MerR family mercuric resistance operon transcriptional regulator
MTMATMTIGKLAKRAGVGVETIRFYERKGLIPEPPRRESGYREYDEETIVRVRFIRGAKELGFTLKEIIGLLSIRVDPDGPCQDVNRRIEAKIGDINERIQKLERMKTTLIRLRADCQGQGPVSECPILEALEEST